MALIFNGTTITDLKIRTGPSSTVIVSEAKVGATIIYTKTVPATTWTYLGTASRPYDGTYSYSYSGGSCRTSTTVRTNLTSARPPSNYSKGFVIRVQHSTYTPDYVPISCTTMYFRAD